MEINVHEAKTNFSKLLKRVEAGEVITIARAGIPIARLMPVQMKAAKRKLGLYSGKIWMSDDFNGPLPPDILAGFLRGDVEPETRRSQPAYRKQRKVR